MAALRTSQQRRQKAVDWQEAGKTLEAKQTRAGEAAACN